MSECIQVVLGNAAGECDSSAALTVKKPDILHLLQELADVDLNEGEQIELTAKVEGQPRTVKWYKNGQEISPDARIQVVRLQVSLAVCYFNIFEHDSKGKI